MKNNAIHVTVQMKRYFANQDEIRRMKLERRNYSVSGECQNEDAEQNCIKDLLPEKDMCDFCRIKHSYYVSIQKLSKENGGILRGVKSYLKKHFDYL